MKQVRALKGHSARVSALAWSGTTLSSGGRDSNIINHDVRCACTPARAARMYAHQPRQPLCTEILNRACPMSAPCLTVRLSAAPCKFLQGAGDRVSVKLKSSSLPKKSLHPVLIDAESWEGNYLLFKEICTAETGSRVC